MRKLLVLLIVLVGCGGGGGGGNGGSTSSDGLPFYGGVWRGDTVRTSDPCNAASLTSIPTDIQFVHTVNQDQRSVVLDVLGGATFSGVLNAGNDGFVVATPVQNNGTCSIDTVIKYGAISADRVPVVIVLGVQCGTLNCNILFDGFADRDH